jgi:hypothetical protein
MRLAAVAVHCSFTPVRWLPLPTTPGGRAAVGVLLLAVMLALLALLLRRGEQRLAIDVSEHGAVVLGAAAVERVVGDAVGAHREVVRVRVEIRPHGDGLAAEVWVAARPQVDAAALRAEIEETVGTALRQATGLPVAAAHLKLKVLRAKDLRRYL